MAYSFSITKEQLIKRSIVLLAVATATALAGSGCGGSSGAAENTYSVEADTVVTTASFAKAQLVPRINKICRQAWVVITDNFTEYSSWHNSKKGPPRRFAEAVRLSLLAGIQFHIFDGIYRLGAPQGEEPEVEAIIGSMQSANERGMKQLAPVSSIAQISELYGDYNQRARRFGIDDCLVDEARLHRVVS